MSSILQSIARVNEINIDKRLTPFFKHNMLLLHKFLHTHNLTTAMNFDKFFTENLYSNNGINENAFSFKYVSLQERETFDFKNSPYEKATSQDLKNFNYLGYINAQTKEIIIFEPEKSKYEGTNYSKDYLQSSVFMHEFLHLLTLHGNLEYKHNGKLYEVRPSGVYHNNKKIDRSDNLYYATNFSATSFIETLTETFTKEFYPKTDSYMLPTKLFSYATKMLGKPSYKWFLRRQVDDVYDMFKNNHDFIKFFINTQLYLHPEKITEQEQNAIINNQEIILKTYFKTKSKEYNQLSIKSFVNKLVDVYEYIPFKSNNNFKNVFSYAITNYAKNLLKEKNIVADKTTINNVALEVNKYFENNKKLFYTKKNFNSNYVIATTVGKDIIYISKKNKEIGFKFLQNVDNNLSQKEICVDINKFKESAFEETVINTESNTIIQKLSNENVVISSNNTENITINFDNNNIILLSKNSEPMLFDTTKNNEQFMYDNMNKLFSNFISKLAQNKESVLMK